MNLQMERIQQSGEALKLLAIAREWPALAQQAATESASFADFPETLPGYEQTARAQRTQQTLLKMAGLPAVKQLEDYDFKFAWPVNHLNIAYP